MSSRNNSFELLPLVEDFYTLQGEGFHTGSAAYFIRLGGCDVGCSWCDAKETWNPRIHPPVAAEEIVRRAAAHPAKTVVVTGGEPLMYPLDELCERLHAAGMEVHLETSGSHPFSGSFDWVCLSPKRRRPPLDEAWARADELKVIIETPEDIEWAEKCASRVLTLYKKKNSAESLAPSQDASTAYGDSRRSVAESLPSALADGQQTTSLPKGFSPTEPLLFLQPEWSRRDDMMPVIVEYIKNNPRWRASLQSHKYMRIP